MFIIVGICITLFSNHIKNGVETVKTTGHKFEHIVQSIQLSNVGIQELSAIAAQMNASMQLIEYAASISNTKSDIEEIEHVLKEQQIITEAVQTSVQHLSTHSSNLKQIL